MAESILNVESNLVSLLLADDLLIDMFVIPPFTSCTVLLLAHSAVWYNYCRSVNYQTSDWTLLKKKISLSLKLVDAQEIETVLCFYQV